MAPPASRSSAARLHNRYCAGAARSRISRHLPAGTRGGRADRLGREHGHLGAQDLYPGPERLHLVMHLARAGWLRWKDDLPEQRPKPGKSPLGFRLRFTDGSGFDLTEAGTKKRLAVYLVTDP